MQTSCLAHPRWRAPAFTVHAREYDWLDVFLGAMVRGDWEGFARRLVGGFACAAEAWETGAWPSAAAIDDAATAFRYDHDLLTVEETTAWLEQAGLGLEEWTEHLARQILFDTWIGRLDEVLARRRPDVEVSVEALAAEGLGTRSFSRFASTLAGRAAVGSAPAHPAEGGESVPAGDIDAVSDAHQEWLAALDPADVRTRIGHLARVETGFADAIQAATTSRALRLQIDRHALDWVRVNLARVSFPTIDAAREAALCVRVDGVSLDEVAAGCGQAICDTPLLVDMLEPGLRDAVVSAAAGELVGPVASGTGFELALVIDKRAADLADPLVGARARQAIADQVVSSATMAHVRWPAELTARRR